MPGSCRRPGCPTRETLLSHGRAQKNSPRRTEAICPLCFSDAPWIQRLRGWEKSLVLAGPVGTETRGGGVLRADRLDCRYDRWPILSTSSRMRKLARARGVSSPAPPPARLAQRHRWFRSRSAMTAFLSQSCGLSRQTYLAAPESVATDVPAPTLLAIFVTRDVAPDVISFVALSTRRAGDVPELRGDCSRMMSWLLSSMSLVVVRAGDAAARVAHDVARKPSRPYLLYPADTAGDDYVTAG